MTYEELLKDNILDVFTDIKNGNKIIRILATREKKVAGIGIATTLQEAIDNCHASILRKEFEYT